MTRSKRFVAPTGFGIVCWLAVACGNLPSRSAPAGAPSRAGSTGGRAAAATADTEPVLPAESPRPPRFYEENTAEALATDATSIYWTEPAPGRVRKVDKAGGAVVDLATGQRAPWDLILVGNDVVFTNTIQGVRESSIVS